MKTKKSKTVKNDKERLKKGKKKRFKIELLCFPSRVRLRLSQHEKTSSFSLTLLLTSGGREGLFEGEAVAKGFTAD